LKHTIPLEFSSWVVEVGAVGFALLYWRGGALLAFIGALDALDEEFLALVAFVDVEPLFA
jgi:hypothetical protein